MRRDAAGSSLPGRSRARRAPDRKVNPLDLAPLTAALALFSLVTYGIVDRLKAAFPKLTATHLVLLSIVIGIAVPFLVAYSTFGHDVTVGSRNLNDLNAPALVVLGLLGLGGASILNQTLGSGGSNGTKGAISDIGENQRDPQ